jgi:type II secretory pathway pseudopilin PulG
MTRGEQNRRNGEAGYALLFVLMMAASVAIMLYMQLPRAAFEAQRDKEQLLIDRGEQYKRAIQLYVRKFNRFPADMDALENTQNIRFLRRQYVDPMTGKMDWRIVHAGPGGTLLDSKITTQKQQKDQAAAQTFITELQPMGGAGAATGTQSVNLATRKRPSDDPNAPADPNNPNLGYPNNPVPGDPNNPNPNPMAGAVTVLPDGRVVPVNAQGVPQIGVPQTGAPGMAVNGPPNGFQNGGANGAFPPGTTGGVAGGPTGFPPGFQPPAGLGVQQGGPPVGYPTPSSPTGPPPGSAANLINQILTTPRPGGLNGLPPGQGIAGSVPGGTAGSGATAGGFGTPITPTTSGQIIGGGIAGVASKLEQDGIKMYNNHESYDEWEFVYDLSKDPARAGSAVNPQAAPAQNGNATAAGTGSITKN